MSDNVDVVNPKVRSVYWQYIRGICIIAVVLIHSKNGVQYDTGWMFGWNAGYWLVLRQLINFPVAVFIFLAGYFTNIDDALRNRRQYYSQRGQKLIVPFLIWSSFYTIINVAAAKGNVDIFRTLIKLFLGLSSGQLYYILVLIQLLLVTPVMIRMIQKQKYIKIMIAVTPIYPACIYVYAFVFKTQMPFYQTFFPAWFIFYFAGLWIKIRGYIPVLKDNALIKSILLCIAALLLSVVEGLSMLAAGFNQELAYSQIKVSSFLYTFALINFMFTVKQSYTVKECKFLKILGDNSYGIYFVHCFWLTILNIGMRLIPVFENNLWLYQIVQAGSAIFLSWVCIIIVRKILGSKISGRLFGF